ncbi:unnamed protein product [Thlaspi arvense]|uniref:Potassium channel domain-containing protein n=1 Tax=Thlaspi arvense TaxID=13288 RepID=A0AAU9T894_THLAR|nr:unnamed protein product [Thlaspi arvense]
MQAPFSDYSTTVDLHGFRRSISAPAMAEINDLSHPNDWKTEQRDSKSIVRKAVALLVVYLSLGVLIYWLNQDGFILKNHAHPVVDGLYFCIVTMCTVGYGDITPDSVVTKLFSMLFVLVGFGVLYLLLTSGMFTCVFHLQERYMLHAAMYDPESKISSYTVDMKEGRVRMRAKVGSALSVLMLSLVFGVLVLHFVEKIGWFDSVYLSFMSVTTVGYGEQEAFKTLTGRLLASVWLLSSTLSLVGGFLYLAEARTDKRNRERSKQVLGENMSISQFFAADIDNNGYLSIAEFVIYKLKEMGRITSEDIIPIINRFDQLDPTHRGKITLPDLFPATSV